MKPYKYFDLENASFEWFREKSGYCIRQGGVISFPHEYRETEGLDEKIEYITLRSKAQGYITTKPLEENPSLFLEFSNLEDDRASIISFANTYGLLTGRSFFYRDMDTLEESELEALIDHDYYALEVIGEPLKLWFDEIRDMRFAVQVWEWIRKNDELNLKRIIVWNKSRECVFYVKHEGGKLPLTPFESYEQFLEIMKGEKEDYSYGDIASKEKHPQIFPRLVPGSVILPAQIALQRIINEKIKNYKVTFELFLNERNEIEPRLQPSSLLSAMWLQFLRAATGEKKFRRCKVCLKWEDVTERNVNWSSHPECANRERVRRYREKQKYKNTSAKQVRQR